MPIISRIRTPRKQITVIDLSRTLPFSQFRWFASSQPIMKRKAPDSPGPVPSAGKVLKVNDYCYTPCKRDFGGKQIWPAPDSQMQAARSFLRSWFALLFPTNRIRELTSLVPMRKSQYLSYQIKMLMVSVLVLLYIVHL